jgi:hypothetical protein
MVEIPAWRHPSDLLSHRAFEAVALVHYCAEHEADALDVNSLVARGERVPTHTIEAVT